jgi:acyl carrier protein
VAPVGVTRRGHRRAGPAELLVRLEGLADGEREAAVVEFLREEVARALGSADPLGVDVEQGLFDMGMDSLMSVELKGRIEAAVGRDLPSTLTFNYPNVAALAGYLLAEVLPATTARPPADGVPSARPAASQPVAPDGSDLTEDDLADLLASRLASLRQELG